MKYMKVSFQTLMKTLASRWALLLMAFVSLSALADNKLYIEDFTIAAGETKEVSVLLDNSQEAREVQVDILLPEGLDYVAGSVAKTSRVSGRGTDLQEAAVGDQQRLALFNGTIAPGTGAILTFKVKADASLAAGDYDMVLSNIVISDNTAAANIATNTTWTTTVTSGDLGSCAFGVVTPTLDVAPGEEYTIEVTLDNAGVTNLAAFSGRLTLPAGLTLVPGADGKFDYTDRTPEPMEYQYKDYDGYFTFVLGSTNNTLITGESGVIFSFKVKADATLAATAEILLSELSVASNAGAQAFVSDVTVSVTNTAETLWATLQEQLAALKAQLDEAVANAEEVKDEADVAAAITAAQTAYNALADKLDAAHTAGTLAALVFDTEAQPTVEAIAAIGTAVDAAKARIQANADAQARLNEELAAIEKELGNIENGLTYPDVELDEEDKADIQAIKDLIAAEKERIANATDLDENSQLSDELTAALEALKEKLAAKQAVAEKDEKAAAIYSTLSAELDGLEDYLKEAKEYIANNYADASPYANAYSEDISAQIDALRQKLKEDYDNGLLDDDYTLSGQDAIKDAIDQMKADAATTDEALKALTAGETEVGTAFDEAESTITNDCPDVKDEYLAQLSDLKDEFEATVADLLAKADDLSLTKAEVTAAIDAMKEKIAALIEAAKEAQTATGINATLLNMTRNGQVYSLSGERLDSPRRGQLNIIRQADGSVVKVFVK